MEDFVARWGYWAVFLGALVEGESIILTASFMASMGLLSLKKIMIIAFSGTLVADQVLYWVGRWYGERALWHIQNWFPKLKTYIAKGMRLLEQYKVLYILSFRFIYGIRIISPVIIGSHKGIDSRVFAVLNVLAAFLWTVISCCIGYGFGDLLINRLDTYQRWGVLLVIVMSIIVWYIIRKKR